MCRQKAVIQSRQFPFRFLAAYKVIMELHTLGETQTKLHTVFTRFNVPQVAFYRLLCSLGSQ